MLNESIWNGRVATAFIMLIIFLSMSLLALGFPEKARLMPLMVGIPGTLLSFAQLVIEIRHTPDQELDSTVVATELTMFMWVFVYLVGILGFGFNIAAPILVFAFLRFGRNESMMVATTSAVATFGVLFGVFEQGFAIPLFEGFVIEWLMG